MLSVGGSVSSEALLPLCRKKTPPGEADILADSLQNSSEDCDDDDFAEKFDAYVAKELQGLKSSHPDFIERNNLNASSPCGIEISDPENECNPTYNGNISSHEPPNVPQNKDCMKHQLSTTVHLAAYFQRPVNETVRMSDIYSLYFYHSN
jgi:hypothetical protein